MKKSKLFLIPLVLCQLVFSQIGVNTFEPTTMVDVNGDLRVRELPLVVETNNVDFLAKDTQGNVNYIPRNYFSQSSAGVLNDIVYLQGTNIATSNIGTTVNVPGLTFNYTVKAGERKMLIFTINAAVRATTSGVGRGVFELYDEENTKIASGSAQFGNITANSSLLNAPFPISFQKQVILDNTTGISDLNKTYTLKYTAKQTVSGNSNKSHTINFIPSSFAGYQNDREALLSKLSVLIFNF